MGKKSRNLSSLKGKHGKYFCLNYVRIITLATLVVLFTGGVFAFQLNASGQQVLGASTSCTSPQGCHWYNFNCLLNKWFGSNPCGDNAQGASVSIASLPAKLSPKVFHGLIQFTGEQNTSGATNPYLAGASLNFYWSQIEPTKGIYNWNLIEQDIAPWVTHGKKVIIRITASGNCYPKQDPLSCNRTPNWVYSEGVPSVTDPSGSKHPVYWNPTFLSEWHMFIKAFAQRYDGDSRVLGVNAVTGSDGELRVAASAGWSTILQAWQAVGYSDPVWQNSILTMLGYYATSFHRTPLFTQAGEPYLAKQKGYTEETLLSNVQKDYPQIGFQDDGLTQTRKLNPIWEITPHVEEPLHDTKTTGDTVQGDIQQGLACGGEYIFVFASDIANPQNQSALQWGASQVGKPINMSSACISQTTSPTQKKHTGFLGL